MPKQTTYIDVACGTCQKPLVTTLRVFNSYQRDNNRFFCGSECRTAGRTTSVSKPCANCGNVVTRVISQFKKSPNGNIFCDHSCSASFNNRNIAHNAQKQRYNCLVCNVPVRRYNNVYCSTAHQRSYQKMQYIEQWKQGIESGSRPSNNEVLSGYVRDYIKEKYNNQCAKCGWHEINPVTGNVPVQIDHIDGNSRNNSESNLILLCPNCHSLTPTFMALNKGNGRRNNRYR